MSASTSYYSHVNNIVRATNEKMNTCNDSQCSLSNLQKVNNSLKKTVLFNSDDTNSTSNVANTVNSEYNDGYNRNLNIGRVSLVSPDSHVNSSGTSASVSASSLNKLSNNNQSNRKTSNVPMRVFSSRDGANNSNSLLQSGSIEDYDKIDSISTYREPDTISRKSYTSNLSSKGITSVRNSAAANNSAKELERKIRDLAFDKNYKTSTQKSSQPNRGIQQAAILKRVANH